MKRVEILPLALMLLFISLHEARAAEDVLSVDRTLLIQIAIFVAAIFLMNSLLFKPLLSLLDKREKLTTGTIQEAKRLEEEVKQIIKDYDVKLNEARAQATEERNEIRRQAQNSAEDITGKARKEAQVLLEEAKAKLETETKEIRQKIRPDVEALARDLAARVLGKEI